MQLLHEQDTTCNGKNEGFHAVLMQFPVMHFLFEFRRSEMNDHVLWRLPKLISVQITVNDGFKHIRFRGALIELGKVGNAFTAEFSNEGLSFLENGQTIAYISNQSLVITNAEIRNRLSLGTAARGWFDFIPREWGNLSIQWRDPTQ